MSEVRQGKGSAPTARGPDAARSEGQFRQLRKVGSLIVEDAVSEGWQGHVSRVSSAKVQKIMHQQGRDGRAQKDGEELGDFVHERPLRMSEALASQFIKPTNLQGESCETMRPRTSRTACSSEVIPARITGEIPREDLSAQVAR